MVSTIGTDRRVLTRPMMSAIIPEITTLRYCNVTTIHRLLFLTSTLHQL